MALLPLLLVLALTVAAAAGATGLRRRPPSRESTVRAARHHATVAATAAVVLGLLAAVGTAATGARIHLRAGQLGVVALLVPIAFGIAHTAVLLAGELTWPRPEGDVRQARLLRRGILDAAPRRLVSLAVATLAVAVLVLGLGALVAGPDGRSIEVPAGHGRVLSSSSPFVGPSYGGPAAIGLAVLAALTVGALWVVANRAAVVTADERIEAALRRASAHRVLRGSAGTALVVIGGLLATSGNAVHSAAASAGESALANGLPAGTPAVVLPWVGGALALLGLLGMVGGLVVLCRPAPGVPSDEPVHV